MTCSVPSNSLSSPAPGTAENPIDLTMSPTDEPVVVMTQAMNGRELRIQTDLIRNGLESDDESDETTDLSEVEMSECEDDCAELTERLYNYIDRRMENIFELSPDVQYYIDVEYNMDEMPIFTLLLKKSNASLMLKHEVQTYGFTRVDDQQYCMFAYFDYCCFDMLYTFSK